MGLYRNEFTRSVNPVFLRDSLVQSIGVAVLLKVGINRTPLFAMIVCSPPMPPTDKNRAPIHNGRARGGLEWMNELNRWHEVVRLKSADTSD